MATRHYRWTRLTLLLLESKTKLWNIYLELKDRNHETNFLLNIILNGAYTQKLTRSHYHLGIVK